MTNYQNTKIYIIKNIVDDKCYVGSTVQKIEKRFKNHKYSSKTKYDNALLHNKMREYGCDKFYIELLENYPCKTKWEKFARENYYIKKYDTYHNGYNSRKQNDLETYKKNAHIQDPVKRYHKSTRREAFSNFLL